MHVDYKRVLWEKRGKVELKDQDNSRPLKPKRPWEWWGSDQLHSEVPSTLQGTTRVDLARHPPNPDPKVPERPLLLPIIFLQATETHCYARYPRFRTHPFAGMSPQWPTKTMSLGGERSTFGVAARARAGAAFRSFIHTATASPLIHRYKFSVHRTRFP